MGATSDEFIGSSLKELPGNKVVRLHNVTCVYCGARLETDSTSREHVIGRRFVPKGKLNGYWNLIVNCCRSCNGVKSDLEDDISAITMQPDAFGRHGHEDTEAAADARRKAENSISRQTKKPVRESSAEAKLSLPLQNGVNMAFNFVGPAQVDPNRAFALARMQMMGFFYWVTYDQIEKAGRFWREGFHPVTAVMRADWGNPLIQSFAESVVSWEPRVLASNADGFFKVALRKHPQTTCWSSALEWNHSMRLVGFFGDRQAALEVADTFTKPEAKVLLQNSKITLAYRQETPHTEDDLLFHWEEQANLHPPGPTTYDAP